MKKIFLILLSYFTFSAFSQEKTFSTQEIEINSLLKGTLFTPEKVTKKTKLVILIAGSGPTNRSGNQFGGTTNCLKFLAEDLAKKNIAVFSYDKRLFAQMKAGNIDEKSMLFDDMIIDAQSVINYFKTENKFKKIIIAGHSEGSLIGMVALKDNVDGFISLSGPGRPIDEVLIEQYSKNFPILKTEVEENLALLKEGKTFELKSKNPNIISIFRESIQPYMISWLKFNPIIEIKKLKIPVLIINGTKDLQVTEIDAQLLKEAYPKATLEIIENMNHLFKDTPTQEENIKSYNDGKIPVMPILSEKIVKFLKTF